MPVGKRGLSLLELLIVSVVLSVGVVAYFSLSRQELVTTRELQNRANAVTLARNLLTLVCDGENRAWLDYAGVPMDGGRYSFNVEAIPLSEHAFGPALTPWADEANVEVSVVWEPLGGEEGLLGRVVCIVSWETTGGHERRVEIPAVIER